MPIEAARSWTADLRSVRVVRFALGTTSAVAVAFAFQWPLYMLTPVLTALFLAMPMSVTHPRQILDNAGYILVAFPLGLLFTLVLMPYPLLFVAALGLVLFHIYYLANRRAPFFLVIMCLLAVLMLPMLAMAHPEMAVVFELYFAFSGVLSLVFVLLAHGLLPDPPRNEPVPPRGGFQPGYSKQAALAALKSTVAILPFATLFMLQEWTGQILTMVFAAIFSLTPDLSGGWASGVRSLTSTFIGGLAAVVFYFLIVAMPQFPFFLALMLLTTLIFGAGMFSDRPLAKYLSSSFIAVLILVTSGMGEGVSISDVFWKRMILIGGATLYVVGAMGVLDDLVRRFASRGAVSNA